MTTLFDPVLGARQKAEMAEARKQTAARAMAASAGGELRNSNKAEGGTDLYGIEARCAREFAASPALRNEFAGNLEAYVAYRKAEARGRVRIFGGKHREA